MTGSPGSATQVRAARASRSSPLTLTHRPPPATAPARSWSRSTVGRATPARSASVQATRITLSTPRALISPRSMARSSGASAPGPGAKLRRRSRPGISALSRHGLRRSRAAARSRAASTRFATTELGSVKPRSLSSSARLTGRNSDLDVHPVKQRAGQPGQIAPPFCRRAGAARTRGRALRAGAGIGRQHQREPGRETGRQTQPGNHHLARLQWLPQGIQHVPAEFRRLVEEQAATVGEGRRARPDDASAAAHDRRLGRRVVRRTERRLGHQRAARWQGPRHGMDRGDLKRGRAIQCGQDGRDPFGQHGLASTRRPQQRQVMTTGRADLGGTARSRLPEDVGQVRAGACLTRWARQGRPGNARACGRSGRWHEPLNVGALAGRPHRDRPSRLAVPAQPGQQGAQGGCADHRQPRHQSRLRRAALRDSDLAEPGGRRGRHRREDPTHRPQPPVQTQFTQKSDALDGGHWNGARGRQDRDGDAQRRSRCPASGGWPGRARP